MTWESFRLARLSFAGKLLITFFLLIVGVGYLVATANIYFHHHENDLEPGLTLDDLKRAFHGLEKEVTPEATVTVNSPMLEQVREDGDMREYLDLGGEPAVRALITWLEDGAKEETFAVAGFAADGDPSAQQVLADQCIECHNADGGDAEDYAFADEFDSEPQFEYIEFYVEPEFERTESGPQVISLKPISLPRLVHVTHTHIFTIPAFLLITAALFLMTGYGPIIKTILVPLPLFTVFLDIGGWWLARFAEPGIYLIAAAGTILGPAFALQILGILASMWFGKKEEAA
jgi:hypothetical protein